MKVRQQALLHARSAQTRVPDALAQRSLTEQERSFEVLPASVCTSLKYAPGLSSMFVQAVSPWGVCRTGSRKCGRCAEGDARAAALRSGVLWDRGPRGSPEASACPRYARAVPMCNAGDVAMTGVQTSLSLIDVFMMQR